MIELKNVTQKYKKTIAVENINFTIKKGEIIGILGPKNAGKSTILNILTGYLQPTEGEIIIKDKSKIIIGYMPDNTQIYQELTVKRFIKYIAELRSIKRKDIKQEVEKIIEEVGIKEIQNKLIKNISKEEQQKVSFAGAFLGNSDLIVLDEPMNENDPKQMRECRRLIKTLKQNRTIIIASHVVEEVKPICDTIIMLEKGKIVSIEGKKEEKK